MISIKIDSAAVERQLAELARRGRDLNPVMRKIAGSMLDSVEENFEQQGRPKWKKLAPQTIERRRKKGHWPGKILQATGQLAASVNARSTANSAIVGTNKEYAALHQFGGRTTIGGRSIFVPARPFLTIPDTDIEDISKMIADYLIK